jgi:hypothetical protein
MQTNRSASDLRAAVEALADEYLGRFGVVSIADKYDNGTARIMVTVDGDVSLANAHVPQSYRGFPVDIVAGAALELHAVRRSMY